MTNVDKTSMSTRHLGNTMIFEKNHLKIISYSGASRRKGLGGTFYKLPVKTCHHLNKKCKRKKDKKNTAYTRAFPNGLFHDRR